MPPAPTHAGDPGRLIDLMWNPTARVGRRGITVAAIVDAAVTLADAEGLEALTMRSVADRVGVGAMTLYGYLPGKSELVELMVDRELGHTYQGHPLPAEASSWEDGLWHLAERNWQHLLEHPWLTEAPQGRPILGPGVCRKYEAELQPLDGIGLTDQEMDLTLAAALAQVSQAARWQHDLNRARQASRLTDEQWWSLYGPRLAHAMTDEELPIASRVGESVASAGEPEATWRYALDSLISTIHQRLEQRSPTGSPTGP